MSARGSPSFCPPGIHFKRNEIAFSDKAALSNFHGTGYIGGEAEKRGGY
jgi:hypothetical protein